jgi:hypothetical protein
MEKNGAGGEAIALQRPRKEAQRVTTHIRSFLPLRAEKALFKGIITFAVIFFVSCSHTTLTRDKGTGDSRKIPGTVQEARDAEPRTGDIRVVDGVEYVYGKNVRYGYATNEPLYVWVRRDQYTPGWDLGDRPGAPTKETKEWQELKERLAKLEAQLAGGGAAQSASQAQPAPKPPVSDEAGRKWTSYWKDGNGIESFYDEDGLLQPRRGFIQLWRMKVFPAGSAQKEVVTRDEINCREAQWRTLELRVTYWDGTTRASDKATPWGNVYARSAEEYLIDQHCK